MNGWCTNVAWMQTSINDVKKRWVKQWKWWASKTKQIYETKVNGLRGRLGGVNESLEKKGEKEQKAIYVNGMDVAETRMVSKERQL